MVAFYFQDFLVDVVVPFVQLIDTQMNIAAASTTKNMELQRFVKIIHKWSAKRYKKFEK